MTIKEYVKCPEATDHSTVDCPMVRVPVAQLKRWATGFQCGVISQNVAVEEIRALLAAPAHPAERQEQHPDDAAVDRFAVAMKAKLAKSREKGRHGWQNASAAHLSSLLYRHVYKADPLDVANLAMMLHQNGQAIELPHEARHEQGDEVRRLREALEHCSEVMKDPWKHGEGCISRAINRADAALAAIAAHQKQEEEK